MKKCPKCLNEFDGNFCPVCGYDARNLKDEINLDSESIRFDDEQKNNENFSNNMNNDFYDLNSKGQVSKKSKVATGVLNILLPGVGRLYAGYTTLGLLQFFTGIILGIGYIWSFIDGILILTSPNFRDSDNKIMKN